MKVEPCNFCHTMVEKDRWELLCRTLEARPVLTKCPTCGAEYFDGELWGMSERNKQLMEGKDQ